MATEFHKPYSLPTLAVMARAFDSAKSKTSSTFDSYSIMKPNLASRTWGWSHYGIYIPALPNPLRFFNIMTLIGLPGVNIFDHDEFIEPDDEEFSPVTSDPRNLVTLMTSTAAEGHHFLRGYDAYKECEFPDEEGYPLVWGLSRDMVMTINKERKVVRVTANLNGWSFNLRLVLAKRAAWFVHTPVYQHFSLMAWVTGTIGGCRVNTHGTFNYARACSPQSAFSHLISRGLRIPVDFFTYHIIAIDERTQAIFGEVHAWGSVARRFGYVRRLGEEKIDFYAEKRVDVSVTRYMEKPVIDLHGRPTPMPLEYRLTLRGKKNEDILTACAIVDSPLRDGHGRGFIGAYTWTGQLHGFPREGTGYFELIDLALHEK